MDLLTELAIGLLTVIGVIVASMLVCVGGGIGAFKVLSVVAERGFYLGACRRLASGHGNWADLDEYLTVAWRDDGAYETYGPRLRRLYDIADDTARDPSAAVDGEPGQWRPDLPPAMYAWIREGHSPDLLLDAIDAGYGAPTLDAHRTGGLTLDPDAVQTLLALRS